MNYPRSLITVCIIISCVFFISQCINKKNEEPVIITNARGEQFAGSETCANCHRNIYDTHIKTAHYLTSRPALEKYIKGSFEKGKNVYSYSYNNNVVVAMEKRDSGFYQVEYFRNKEKNAYPFDIVVGSGAMGQSYLYWRHNYLLQLPITYFTAANTWSNSPGYPDRIVFNRIITSRCLECHVTYINPLSEPDSVPEKFDKTRIVYGIDCEKCHGPAAKHVEFQTQNPTVKIAKYIINPGKFTRQQKLDLCAACHGGKLPKIKPSFAFSPGDRLSDYFKVDTSAPHPDSIDVHGNQYGLLRASKCFQRSEMTCITCHNTHENQRGQKALFSQKCMTCHDNVHEEKCKLTQTMGTAINTNCVDCHMPVRSSKVIAVQLKGGTMPIAALIRSHFIKVYPEETKKILAAMKSSDQIH